jgi:hypothetical protein
LLTWLLIASELVLIAAELNVVLARRLWPRSLAGDLLETDKRALRDSVCSAQADLREHITVAFTESDRVPADPAKPRPQTHRTSR